MKKKMEIILFCLLAACLIAILCLTIWWSKNNAWEPDDLQNASTEEIKENNKQDSEQDILNDLESLFHNDNGYENIWWEFGFISSENQQ